MCGGGGGGGGEGSKVPKKVYDYIFEQPLRRNGHTFLVDFFIPFS